MRDAKAAEHLLNTRSTILTDDEYEEDSIGIDEYDLNEVDNINTEIMDYISSSPVVLDSEQFLRRRRKKYG